MNRFLHALSDDQKGDRLLDDWLNQRAVFRQRPTSAFISQHRIRYAYLNILSAELEAKLNSA